jgi:hypothetical protein
MALSGKYQSFLVPRVGRFSWESLKNLLAERRRKTTGRFKPSPLPAKCPHSSAAIRHRSRGGGASIEDRAQGRSNGLGASRMIGSAFAAGWLSWSLRTWLLRSFAVQRDHVAGIRGATDLDAWRGEAADGGRVNTVGPCYIGMCLASGEA